MSCQPYIDELRAVIFSGCKLAAGCHLAVFLLSGCAAPKIKRLPKRPPLDPQHFIKQIISGNQQTRDLSGFSKFSIQSRDKSQSGKIAVNLKKNAFMRFGFLNFLGQPVHFFLANKQYLLSFNPAKKRAITGKPSLKNVNRLIGVRMEVEDLVTYLLGAPPDLESFSHKPVIYEPGTDRYRLVAEGEDKTSELWVDPDTHRPVQYKSYDKEKNTLLLVKWDDFQLIEGIHFAARTIIELPREETVVEVEYTDFDLNSGTGVFSLEIPSGTQIVLLDG